MTKKISKPPKPKKKSFRTKLEDSFFEELNLFRAPLPQRQFKFRPDRNWSFDFAWPEKRFAVEVMGGIYIGKGHSRGARIEEDHDKQNEAVMWGWRVLKFGPKALYVPKKKPSSEALVYTVRALKILGLMQ
jgi:very-short-patch-repair endonuclease